MQAMTQGTNPGPFTKCCGDEQKEHGPGVKTDLVWKPGFDA